MILTVIEVKNLEKTGYRPNGKMYTDNYDLHVFVDENNRKIISFNRGYSLKKFRIHKSLISARSIFNDYYGIYQFGYNSVLKNELINPSVGDVYELECELEYSKEFNNYKMIGKCKFIK